MGIQIIPENRKPRDRTFSERIGARDIGEAFGSALSERMIRSSEDEAIKRNYGLDLSGIRDPSTRQQLIADQLKFGRQIKQARATQNTTDSAYPNRPSYEETQNFVNENRPPKEDLPSFYQEPRKGTPTSTPANEIPFSHNPQTETKGRKFQQATPDQLMAEGNEISIDRTNRGLPTSLEEGVAIALQRNQLKQNYNAQVDQDIAQQVQTQEKYGTKAVEELAKVFPEATSEHEALAAKWGEEAVQSGKTSEAAIRNDIAQKIKQFKNRIANIKKSLPAPRIQQRAKESLLGTTRLTEDRRDDLRVKLEPLLKEGLYDTSRNLLSELGYHPEERESVITELGEIPKKSLAQFPDLKKTNKLVGTPFEPRAGAFDQYYSPRDLELISSSIKDIISKDPSVNLILLRKAYEDKGVDWQAFKNVINKSIINGEMKLNPDQENHLDLLDYPPLDRLDTILFHLGLIGR